jgi:preprotein translocase subunit SecF
MIRHRLSYDDTTIAFMRARIVGLIISLALSVASLILAFCPGLNYGIEFRGGIAIVAHMPNGPDLQQLRVQLDELEVGAVELQELASPLDVQVSVYQQPANGAVQQDNAKAVRDLLLRTDPDTTMQSVNVANPSVSAQRFRDGLIVLAVALIVMIGYFWMRFEWWFALAGTTTLALNATKIVGLYALTQFAFNTASIVAILTIIAYSIYDKAVLYDRVRDNLRLCGSMRLSELIDRSVNETLGRRIAVSGAALLTILPLAVLGGGNIQQFAAILFMGIVIVSLSSIFVAAPILLLLLGEGCVCSRREQRQQSRVRRI